MRPTIDHRRRGSQHADAHPFAADLADRRPAHRAVEQAAGRPAEAESWLAACAEHLSAFPAVALPAFDHGRGLVALAAGATGVARLALESAIEGWGAQGRIWETTWARLDLANCLTRLNRFADAVALALDARAVASRLDSRPLADRADALHRMARGHVSADEPWRPLTAREFAVARLITEGMTNAEIASELSIAPKTASSHVEHILAKLGASRRTEIAAWTSAVEHAAGRDPRPTSAAPGAAVSRPQHLPAHERTATLRHHSRTTG